MPSFDMLRDAVRLAARLGESTLTLAASGVGTLGRAMDNEAGRGPVGMPGRQRRSAENWRRARAPRPQD